MFTIKKYILTSPASTVSLSSGCFFFLGFNHPTLQAAPPHAILNYQTIPQVSASHISTEFEFYLQIDENESPDGGCGPASKHHGLAA